MALSTSTGRDRKLHRKAGLAAVLALGALAAVPAIASAAGNVTTAGNVITYTGDAGVNTLTIDDAGGDSYQFTETGITEASGSCTVAASTVTCSGGSWNQVIVNTLGANDSVNATASDDDDIDMDGGTENDVLVGSAQGSETLSGGDGNDRLDPGPNGNGDNDVLDGGTGIDRAVFGIVPGATYTCTAQPLNIDLDGTADDDICSDNADDSNIQSTIESITGSTLADTLTGSCGANTFAGSAGTANGAADGADTFNGDPAGCVAGDARSDFFGGGEGADIFNGDAGFDTVTYGLPYTGVGPVNVDWGGGNDDADGMGNSDDVQTDINRVIGGDFADTINATTAPGPAVEVAGIGVTILGHAGDDILTGGGLTDTVDGEAGVDTLDCAGGTDFFRHDGAGPGPVAPVNCEIPF
jgi:Ca2+-binding RTX toxin-like protein